MFDVIWYDYKDGDIEKIIQDAKKRSRTEYVWLANNNVDYTNFNFRFFPNRHQTKYKHAWASHKNPEHYTTWLIPVNHDEGTVHHKELILDSNTNYYDICCVDTTTHDLPNHDFKVNLITTMQNAVELAVNKTKKPWLWIICDVCDYAGFDFDWLPNNHDMNYIHCWPSGKCEKGDTFLINVKSYLSGNKEYNFKHEAVKRKPWPMIIYNDDTVVKSLEWKTNAIYNIFTRALIDDKEIFDVCLWEKRPVVSLNKSNSISLIPRDCVVKNEIYEYPYLLKEKQYEDEQCDVVFISNFESMSYENYQHLQKIYPNAKHSYGVDGRDKAYKVAANLSQTPYFYAVFAKTQVYENFKFDFYPDYWQEPKHYIFHSANPLNGLEYGSMNVNLYNKNLVLQTNTGLDFTLSSKHTVVPRCISTTRFNDDPYITWRSAFREVIKLRQELETHNRVEVAYRYHCWKTIAVGDNAEWCLRGANDADKFYDNVNGNPTELQNSFGWEWCKDYFNSIYNNSCNNLDAKTN